MMSSSLLHYVSPAWPLMVDLVFNFTTGLVTRDQPETAVLLTRDIMSRGHHHSICNEYNQPGLQSSDQPDYYQTNPAVFVLQSLAFSPVGFPLNITLLHIVNTDSLCCCDRRRVVVVVS